MAERKSAGKSTKTASRFTAEERAAMRERTMELSAAAGEDQESVVLEKIAAMAPADRAMGERVHAIVRAHAPELAPRLWYGMPAYAKKGKVLCFFQDAKKFRTRYATLGFSDQATLDDGDMWPNSYALQALTSATEKQIVDLLRRATR